SFTIVWITGHKWAGPFKEPVDVAGLGLHDYYETLLDKFEKWLQLLPKVDEEDERRKREEPDVGLWQSASTYTLRICEPIGSTHVNTRRIRFILQAKKEWGLSPKAMVRVLLTAQLDVTGLNRTKPEPQRCLSLAGHNGDQKGVMFELWQGQKNTLAEYMILSGADNSPPMLEKDMYNSWKSRMELYIQNREHERMILE
nr:transcription factor GTE6-like isoform X2 [Tanacetum cinerariifolium]